MPGLRHLLGQVGLNAAKKFIWSLDHFFGRSSKVGEGEFYDARHFPWIKSIEADWRKVRDELEVLLPYATHMPNFQDLSKDQLYVTQDDGWKTYFFYAYGLKAWRNCRRCPQTTALLKRIPGMKTAFFSIFMPHKHLPKHRGPYKGVLRLHLALLVPEPAEDCGIRVGSELRHWHEGQVMIFDDTITHEAWNHTEETRVVLFVDIMRPMRFPANLVNAILVWVIAFSPFVLGSAGTYLSWERRFEEILNRNPAAN